MTVSTTGQTGILTLLVAEEVRALMGRRRISGAGLARELGVSQMWVSDRLRGTTPMTLTDLERIAGVFGVPFTELLPRSTSAMPATELTPGSRLIKGVTRAYPKVPDRPVDRRPPARPSTATPAPASRRPARVRPHDGRMAA